jgi:hypothetical protein
VKYPWLDARDIELAAHVLLLKSLGAAGAATACIDLDAMVFNYLCEKEHLCFDDERDLGWDDGDQVLGRMKPLKGKIEITAVLMQHGELGRYRFTLAHEIGHWVLHRPLFLAATETLDLFGPNSGDIQVTSLNRSVFPDGSRGRPAPEEWQANRFAVELLINRDLLRVEFTKRFGHSAVALHSPPWVTLSRTLREHARLLAGADVKGERPLCSIFGLSAEAMGIALLERGYAVEEPPLL